MPLRVERLSSIVHHAVKAYQAIEDNRSTQLGERQTGIYQWTGWHAESDSDGRGFEVQRN